MIDVAYRSMKLALDDIINRLTLVERRLSRFVQRDLTPTGSMSMFAGSTPPAGYVLCQGQTLLVADYPGLFAVLGTTYGGDGITTFGVPDMRGRVPVGVNPGDSDFGTLNQAVGAKTHTLTAAQMPSHTHAKGSGWLTYASSGNNGAWPGPGSEMGTLVAGGNSGSAGGGGAHNNIQPSRAVHFIIKT